MTTDSSSSGSGHKARDHETVTAPLVGIVLGLAVGVGLALASGCGKLISSTTGEQHGCPLLSDGSLKCWASGSSSSTPVQVTGLTSGATQVVAGEYFTCALISGGAKCWGSDQYGQLGDGY